MLGPRCALPASPFCFQLCVEFIKDTLSVEQVCEALQVSGPGHLVSGGGRCLGPSCGQQGIFGGGGETPVWGKPSDSFPSSVTEGKNNLVYFGA